MNTFSFNIARKNATYFGLDARGLPSGVASILVGPNLLLTQCSRFLYQPKEPTQTTRNTCSDTSRNRCRFLGFSQKDGKEPNMEGIARLAALRKADIAVDGKERWDGENWGGIGWRPRKRSKSANVKHIGGVKAHKFERSWVFSRVEGENSLSAASPESSQYLGDGKVDGG